MINILTFSMRTSYVDTVIEVPDTIIKGLNDSATITVSNRGYEDTAVQVNLSSSGVSLSVESMEFNVEAGESKTVDFDITAGSKIMPYLVYAKVTAGNNETFAIGDGKVVSEDVELDTVTLASDETVLEPGDTTKLTVTAKMSDGSDADLTEANIEYGISYEGIASIDGDGNLSIADDVGDVREFEVWAIVTLDGKTVMSNKLVISIEVPEPEPSAALELIVNKDTVHPGDTFDAIVRATQAVALEGLELVINYDDTLFDVTEGDIAITEAFGQAGETAFIMTKVQDGQIKIIASTLRGRQINGDTDLFVITFTARYEDKQGAITLKKGSSMTGGKEPVVWTLEEDVEVTVTVDPYDPADVNRDGAVDIADLVLVARAFGMTAEDKGFNPRYDRNNDGIIDIEDIAYIAVQILG